MHLLLLEMYWPSLKFSHDILPDFNVIVSIP